MTSLYIISRSVIRHAAALCAVALAVFPASCVRDDGLSGRCRYPLRLEFAYTYNREGCDLLKDELTTLHLYLYDTADGTLSAMADVPVSALGENGRYDWAAPAGRHTLVVWGEDRAGYRHSAHEMIDTHRFSVVDAEMNDAHLWHNMTTDLLINGSVTPVYGVEMRKLSNVIGVTVCTSDGSDLPEITAATVTASNGTYTADGRPCSQAGAVTYRPVSDFAAADSHLHRFCVPYLSDGDDSQLNVTMGQTELYSGSLTGLLKQNDDVDLDLDDDFQLRFTVTPEISGGSATVGVEVNGWVIKEYNVSLI